MTSSQASGAFDALPRADDPVAGRMVIVGCSRRKRWSSEPVPALDLYEGGCVPAVRARLGSYARLRARVRILSARHGLVTADTPLMAYDQRLDARAAARMRPSVTAALIAEFTVTGVPAEVLVVAEPLYLVLIADLLAAGIRLQWVPDVRRGWSRASAVLDIWKWP
jgi:hypothetical protein